MAENRPYEERPDGIFSHQIASFLGYGRAVEVGTCS